MFDAIKNPYLVPYDGSFRYRTSPTEPPQKVPGGKKLKKLLEQQISELSDLQKILYAHDHHAILLLFQAMDAAGKDSTIRAVMSGINPAGCQVFSFKQPTPEELDHDFLWRTTKCLPERGRIGIFNRSYYEEVLIVRVHPKFLDNQKLPDPVLPNKIWQERFESICDYEKHLARNGLVILKFWLNVSKEEQRQRFLSRIEEPHKNWKFSDADLKERQFWPEYMQAFEDALKTTSKPWAPWYAIPADDKPYMRLCVAEIVVESLKSLNLKYPNVNDIEKRRFLELAKLLEQEK